jgi:GNAT superfamily N-acetyltransferase
MELARPAGAADRQICTRLLSQALLGAATMRGGVALVGEATPATLLARWTEPGDEAVLLVGEYDSAVVGLLGATVAAESGGRRSTLIECCYVETGARGVGVGTALMQGAVDWSTQQGCTDIDALALPGDRATKQRLEAAGFTARLLVLNRRLG